MDNFGKYRAKVVDPNDPLQLGRIIALVPAISEMPLSWALPAAPYTGPGVGFFAFPPEGANVWIEFEGGDPNYPIWSNCFWGENEAPVGRSAVVLQTNVGALRSDDAEMALRLSLAVPDGVVSLAMTAAGIELSFNEVGIRISKDAVTVNGVVLGGREVGACHQIGAVAVPISLRSFSRLRRTIPVVGWLDPRLRSKIATACSR